MRACASLRDNRLYQPQTGCVKISFTAIFHGAASAAFLVACFCNVSIAIAPPSGEVAATPRPIELSDLPEPPEPLGDLIEAGRVTFEAGEREESTELSGGLRTAAETHYKIAYNYNSRSRWAVDSANRRLRITVRFFSIRWEPTHVIWFRRRPETDGFWSDVLVRHEFDHVRISNDPRLAKRFEEMLREKSVISHQLSEGDVVNRPFVDHLVAEHVDNVFAEISELIAIRYKELDRVTRHGRDAVPEDSPLNRWLKPDSSQQPQIDPRKRD